MPEPTVIPVVLLALSLILFMSTGSTGDDSERIGQAARTSHAMLEQRGFVAGEFIFTDARFRSCHASTLVETPMGLVAAWFGGDKEGANNVGIWAARKDKDSDAWTEPVEIASSGSHPCWNPVLVQQPRGPLHLFYKVGPSPKTWWGMHQASTDGGKTWSKPKRLPTLEQGVVLGPVRAKPILLDDGRLLCGSSTEHDRWRVHFEWTSDWGKTWQRTKAVNDGETFSAIQPTFLRYPDSRIQALCRSRQEKIVQVWSADGGRSWSEMTATELPNPSAGIDAVTLTDGRQLLIYNHTPPGHRRFLNLAMTTDGKQWKAAGVLEHQDGEFSYPAMIQTSDAKVHMVYTWLRRRMRHVVVDPTKLQLRDIREGQWPQPKVIYD